MNKITLDYTDNIILDKTFPIGNLDALNYLVEGLHSLAVTVREYEIKFFKEEEGSCYINAYGGIEKHSMLMNMFNWFSIDIINYLRLIAFIDFVQINNIQDEREIQKKYRQEMKNHCKSYVEKLVPEILIWRNKLSAHHSITDPYKDDNIATFHTSLMNNIIYRNPYYQASGFIYHYQGEETKIRPWCLTEIYDKLTSRLWPELKLKPIPLKDEVTGLFRVINQKEFLTREELIEKYNDIIEKNLNTENEKILEEVAQTYSEKGELLFAMNEYEEAISNYEELNNLREQTKNDEILFQKAKGIFGTALIYSKINRLNKELEQYDKCINLFKLSQNENILLIVLDCYLNKSYQYSKPGMNHKTAFETYKEALEIVNNIEDVKNKKEFVLLKAKILINNIDLIIRWKAFEEAIKLCDEVLSLRSLSDEIILEKNKAKALKKSIINH